MKKVLILIILPLAASALLKMCSIAVYAAPLYRNPAMTGSSEMTRIGVKTSEINGGLDQSFTSYSAYIRSTTSSVRTVGIGLIVEFKNLQQEHG